MTTKSNNYEANQESMGSGASYITHPVGSPSVTRESIDGMKDWSGKVVQAHHGSRNGEWSFHGVWKSVVSAHGINYLDIP
ncbi:hypothetical protein TNCT_219281 [Trichonephila clavata]|uniref:Uncharacterized protein n=1 Tax=Trichonephila clavata TaxID=2740835 RepID=A0A8X6HDK4_TRICU|nr:hypothetical protein TNCT_219281 [Trichonephila clavata]